LRRTTLSGLAAATGAAVGLVLAVAPAGAAVRGPARASAPSPFRPGCNGPAQTGTNYLNAEVEPYLATDPTRPRNLVGVWQQDRWSNGGANGLIARQSTDAGRTWRDTVNPPFSRCAGGTARNGGDYERASDPWVTFAPNGDAYFISLSFNDSNPTNAILVSKSRDGGHQWGPIRTLIRDTDPSAFNDKEAITADPTDSQRVYAVWDRGLQPDPASDDFVEPTYFSRTVNGAASFEPAHAIFDPGVNNATIGNIINVLPDGTLLCSFDLFLGDALNVALIRSTDHGVTWSADPTFVDQLGTIGVVDPRDGADVRTGDILPILTVDPRPGHRNVYAVWQDARFSGGQSDQIAFSRSTDGGTTWSPAVRVSPPGDVQAFTPTVQVNAAGEIAITYYDFTFTTATSPALATDYWVTRSTDGGRTFSPRERLTRTSFDMRTAPNAGGLFIGDYQGLSAGGNRFDTLYVGTNSGDATNLTDTFYAAVSGQQPTVGPQLSMSAIAQPKRSTRIPGRLPHPGGPVTVH
jgi:hypothetical protein